MVSTIYNFRLQHAGIQTGDTNTDSDLAHLGNLGKMIVLNMLSETLKNVFGALFFHILQNYHKFFTTVTEHLVILTEKSLCLLGKMQQHFITIKMSKTVINLFEMINIDNGKTGE